jgi:hypothetical protein
LKQKRAVKIANDITKHTFLTAADLVANGIPVSIENPATSL